MKTIVVAMVMLSAGCSAEAVGRGLQGFAAAQQYQQPQIAPEMDHQLTLPAERMRNCWTTCTAPGFCSTQCQ